MPFLDNMYFIFDYLFVFHKEKNQFSPLLSLA